MNVEIIMSMVKPYVKDGAITYDEFDQLFSFLSRKEQYEVCEVLNKKGINLVDAENTDDEAEVDIDSDSDAEVILDDDFEILYDLELFKDKGYRNEDSAPLIVNRNVRQSNEILCSLIQQGSRQAVQDLCIKNQRLVDKYVAAYLKRYGNRLEFEDLEQAGFIGLIKAAHKFDVAQGTAFSTYAVFWLRQSIKREIMDYGYPIRIPVYVMERIEQVTAANNRLEGNDIPMEQRIHQVSLELGYTEEEVRECLVLRKNYLGCTSLDSPVGDDEDALLGDFIPYEDAITVEEMIFDKSLRKELELVIKTLTSKEQQVINLRFGLDDGVVRTLEEVGEIYGVTRERIRQIEVKALRKLRHPSRLKKIQDYYT